MNKEKNCFTQIPSSQCPASWLCTELHEGGCGVLVFYYAVFSTLWQCYCHSELLCDCVQETCGWWCECTVFDRQVNQYANLTCDYCVAQPVCFPSRFSVRYVGTCRVTWWRYPVGPEEQAAVMKDQGQSQPYLSIFSCVNRFYRYQTIRKLLRLT